MANFLPPLACISCQRAWLRCPGIQSHLLRKEVKVEPGARRFPGKVASGLTGVASDGQGWKYHLKRGVVSGGPKRMANISAGPWQGSPGNAKERPCCYYLLAYPREEGDPGTRLPYSSPNGKEKAHGNG